MGLELIKKAIDYIRLELKEPNIRISAQEYLIGFYSSFGFEIVSSTYMEDGLPHIEMLREDS